MLDIHFSDPNAPLPEGTNPVDVAALAKCYLASLPEPLVTFELYNEIRGARTSINALRNIFKKLPNVNYMTLEFTTALLLRVSQKALLNKAGTLSLFLSLVVQAYLFVQSCLHRSIYEFLVVYLSLSPIHIHTHTYTYTYTYTHIYIYTQAKKIRSKDVGLSFVLLHAPLRRRFNFMQNQFSNISRTVL